VGNHTFPWRFAELQFDGFTIKPTSSHGIPSLGQTTCISKARAELHRGSSLLPMEFPFDFRQKPGFAFWQGFATLLSPPLVE